MKKPLKSTKISRKKNKSANKSKFTKKYVKDVKEFFKILATPKPEVFIFPARKLNETS